MGVVRSQLHQPDPGLQNGDLARLDCSLGKSISLADVVHAAAVPSIRVVPLATGSAIFLLFCKFSKTIEIVLNNFMIELISLL